MRTLKKHFSCLILLLLNLTSKPFNLKYLTLYFSPIQSCSRLDIGPITCALSANRSQKRSKTFFMTTTSSSNFKGYSDWHSTAVTSESSLLNYLILIGKIYFWSCRRTEVLPHIDSFIVKVNIKYETEKYICTKKQEFKKINGQVEFAIQLFLYHITGINYCIDCIIIICLYVCM